MKSNKVWTKEKIENYLIKLLVDNCHEILQLEYNSTKLTKSESPDFIVDDCENIIGVEITRAMDKNVQWVNDIRGKCFENIAVSQTAYEDKNLTTKEINNILNKSKDKIIGKPYKGYKLEEKVTNDIISAISKKIKKFDSYKKFNKNILLVHSEMRASLDINIVIERLVKYTLNTDIVFDLIFLKLSNKLYYFTKQINGNCKIKT